MKKKEQVKDRYYGFLFFIFAYLILVSSIVVVQQIRISQFNNRLFLIENSVERIESGVGGLVGTIERYERAMDLPEQEELGKEFLVGNRIKETINENE